MSNISNWSSVDDNNNRVPPDGFPEHQSPSSLNNSARALMGGVRRAYLEQPYFNPGGVIQYVNASTFQIPDTSEITNFSVFYPVGRRVKTLSTNGILYGNVGSVTYNGGITEIKLALDSGAELDAATSAVYCGLTREDTGEIVGRLPVGMILPYTAMTLPPGFLYADGGSFDPDIYTELASIWRTGEDEYLYGQEIVGGKYWVKTPDVRGQFPRYLDMGAGIDPDGETRGIGEVQTDAIRNITGTTNNYLKSNRDDEADGAFKYVAGTQSTAGGNSGHWDTSRASFDASLVVPTAEENRPTNMAFPALIVAWHGITPAENISIQDLLTAFGQMQGSIDQIYEAKDEALTSFNEDAQVIINNAESSINYASSTAVELVNETSNNAVQTVNTTTATAIASVEGKADEIRGVGDVEIERVQNAAESEIATASSWATGDITERPEGSAKYWANSANPNTRFTINEASKDVAGNANFMAVSGEQILFNGAVKYTEANGTLRNYNSVSPIALANGYVMLNDGVASIVPTLEVQQSEPYWKQPNVTSSDIGYGIVTASSQVNEARGAWCALQTTDNPTTIDGSWSPTSVTGWWKLVFNTPKKLSQLIHYSRAYIGGGVRDYEIYGAYYADEAKTMKLGDINNTTANEETVLSFDEIITDTIYFEKTGGGQYAGIGRLKIKAVDFNTIWFNPYNNQAKQWNGTAWVDYTGIPVGRIIDGVAYNYQYNTYKSFQPSLFLSKSGRQLVSSYQDEENWYKIFAENSNGKIKYWCEQSGYLASSGNYTIQLLQPFNNVNYFVSLTIYSTANQGLSPTVGDKALTSFSGYGGDGGRRFFWKAEGYCNEPTGV